MICAFSVFKSSGAILGTLLDTRIDELMYVKKRKEEIHLKTNWITSRGTADAT